MCVLKIILLLFICPCSISLADVILLNDNVMDNVNNSKPQEKDNNKEKVDTGINKKLAQLPKTIIKYDEKQVSSNENPVKVNAITYFTFGTEGKPIIEIYVSPSCLHCAQFLREDLVKFLEKHSADCFVKVMLLPVEAKDFFIMSKSFFYIIE